MKPQGPLEKIIEEKVCTLAKSRKVLCYKFTSPSRRSVPDRLFIGPKGTVWFVEFKRLGLQPTESQAIEIDKIKRQGIPVFVVDSVTAGQVMLEKMMGSENVEDY